MLRVMKLTDVKPVRAHSQQPLLTFTDNRNERSKDFKKEIMKSVQDEGFRKKIHHLNPIYPTPDVALPELLNASSSTTCYDSPKVDIC